MSRFSSSKGHGGVPLSDACFEFLESLPEAAQALAEESAPYAKMPFRYGAEIEALLSACRDVQAEPGADTPGMIRLPSPTESQGPCEAQSCLAGSGQSECYIGSFPHFGFYRNGNRKIAA
jgi:hypothetical protein